MCLFFFFFLVFGSQGYFFHGVHVSVCSSLFSFLISFFFFLSHVLFVVSCLPFFNSISFSLLFLCSSALISLSLPLFPPILSLHFLILSLYFLWYKTEAYHLICKGYFKCAWVQWFLSLSNLSSIVSFFLMASTISLFHEGVFTSVNSKGFLSLIWEFKVTSAATITSYTESF